MSGLMPWPTEPAAGPAGTNNGAAFSGATPDTAKDAASSDAQMPDNSFFMTLLPNKRDIRSENGNRRLLVPPRAIVALPSLVPSATGSCVGCEGQGSSVVQARVARRMPMQDRVRIRSVEVLSDDWAVLKKTVLDYRRRDGTWETQIRQTYDRGDGAVILPYDPERKTVLLVRQFRFPAYVTGHPELLIEACAGLLDADDPETAIRREAEEELGYRLRDLRHVYTSYMSPGSLTERLSFFTAGYTPTDRISDGGGHPEEGEDIEVLELSLDDALAAIHDGRIVDAKTIMLIQHLKLEGCR
jgi:nudix-type nucleoside diphosphatase (YffH/AdpP family)